MKKKLILFVVLMSIFVNCTPNEPLVIQKELIFLDTDSLKQGQEFSFYYNTNHKDAKFKDSSEIFAGLGFSNNSNMKYYLVKMIKIKNGFFKGQFSVPHSKDILFILIGEKNKINSMFRDNRSFPIYNMDGIMSKKAINYFMLNSKSQEEFNKYFTLDTTFYPDNFDRNFIISRLSAEKSVDSLGIIRRIEVLEKIMNENYATNFPIKVNCLTNLINIYQLVGNWGKSLEYLDSLSNLIKNSSITGIKLSDYESNLLEMPFFSIRTKFMTQPSREEFTELIDKYTNLAYLSNSNLMNTYLLRNFSFNNLLKIKTQKNSKFVENYIKIMDSNFINGNFDEYITFPDIFISLHDCLFKFKDYNNCEKILRYAIKFENKFSKYKISKDTNDFLTFNLGNDGIEPYKLQLTKILSLTNRIDSAKSLALEIYNNKSKRTDFFEGSKLVTLIEIYLLENSIDSAEFYLTKLYSLNDERAYQNLNLINKQKSLNKIDTLSEKDFIKKAGIKYLEMEQLPDFFLKIKNSPVNTSVFKDTSLVLLNINDECAVCNLFVPEIQKILEKDVQQGRCKIIFISNLPDEKLHEAFGKELIISKRSEEIKLLLKMDEKDWRYVYIVKNKKYLNLKNYSKEISWYRNFF